MRAPTYLNKFAKTLWKKLQPQMNPNNQETVEMACLAYGTYREAEETLQKEGRVITNSRGTLVAHPAVDIQQKAFSQFLRLMAALNIQDKPVADDFDAFLRSEKR